MYQKLTQSSITSYMYVISPKLLYMLLLGCDRGESRVTMVVSSQEAHSLSTSSLFTIVVAPFTARYRCTIGTPCWFVPIILSQSEISMVAFNQSEMICNH